MRMAVLLHLGGGVCRHGCLHVSRHRRRRDVRGATVTLTLSPAGPMFRTIFLEPTTLAPWRRGWFARGSGPLLKACCAAAPMGRPATRLFMFRPTGRIAPSRGRFVFRRRLWRRFGRPAQPGHRCAVCGLGVSGGSPGGSNVLKLIKFQSWSVFGYSNVVNAVMRQVALPNVGADWHTLKLVFEGRAFGCFMTGRN